MSVSANPNYGVTSAAGATGGVTLSGGTAWGFRFDDLDPSALAGFQFRPNGNVYKVTGSGQFQVSSATDWIRPDTLAPGTYYIRIVNVNWTSISQVWNQIDSPEDTWIDLTANRTWSVLDGTPFAGSDKDVSFDVEIKRGAAGPTVATGTYSLHSEYEDFGLCFGPDTIVLMEDDSEKLMKDLSIGDTLKSYSVPNRIDESDPEWVNWSEPSVEEGTFTTSEVVSLSPHPQRTYFLINNELKVTAAHRLLVYRDSVSNWMWVRPNDIAVGDTFYSVDKVEIPISSIELVIEDLTTYNINVEEVDSFYVKVGDEFIVAHNKVAP